MTNVLIEKTYGLVANPLNNKLIVDLKAKGAEVLIFPVIKAERIELSETDEDYIVNLTDFDWLIFADVFAADYFIENLREFDGTDYYDLDDMTICALGEAVADRLRFVQVHADVIPAKTDDEAVFTAIKQFVGGGFEGLRILVAREKTADLGLIEKLKNEKAIVIELPVYRATFEHDTSHIKLKTLLKSGAVDEFIFSSAEDVSALKFLLEGENLADSLIDLKIFATTEIAFQTLQEKGLRPLYFHYK